MTMCLPQETRGDCEIAFCSSLDQAGEALEPELIYSDREKDFCDLAVGPQNKPEDLVSPKGDFTHSTLPSKSVPFGFAQVEPLRVSMNNWE